MILALGARGPEFDSLLGPFLLVDVCFLFASCVWSDVLRPVPPLLLLMADPSIRPRFFTLFLEVTRLVGTKDTRKREWMKDNTFTLNSAELGTAYSFEHVTIVSSA